MVQLNDEVFLRKLNEIVEELKRRQFRALMPRRNPETIEEYEDRHQTEWDFGMLVGERLREMEVLLELVEPSHINMALRTVLEFYSGILENPPWERHAHPTPLYPFHPGRPVTVKPKVSTEPAEEEVGPEG